MVHGVELGEYILTQNVNKSKFLVCRRLAIYPVPFEWLSLFGWFIHLAKQHIRTGPGWLCEGLSVVRGVYYAHVQPLGGCVYTWVSALRRGRAPQSANDKGLQASGGSGVPGPESCKWTGQWITFSRSKGGLKPVSIALQWKQFRRYKQQ